MQTILESRRISEEKTKDFLEENKPRVMWTGYGLLGISAAFYAACEYFDFLDGNTETMIFLIHYVLALAFLVVLIMARSFGFVRSFQKENIHKTIVLLNLFLISAYALNREMIIFHSSTPWLCVYIVTTSLAGLCYRFYHQLPGWLQAVIQCILGSAIIFYLYLTLYVTEGYLIGTVGTLLLGVGAHIFVPGTLLIGTVAMIRFARAQDRSFYWIVIGGILTIVYAALFAVEWNKRIEKIADIRNQSVMYPDAPLTPAYTIAQSIKPDWITIRVLKSDLVYTTSQFGHWNFFPTGIRWGEVRRHDPLVLIASLFSKSTLTVEERKEILKAIFNKRHEAEDRLWNGSDLTTSYIISDVDVYPDLRIAYTEKYLNIRNNSEHSFRDQEAIYTFQLPEGSVITSLSLWINGTESKGILTSKEKAAKAYNQIVGVEVRDPSVVHWQEGNRVTVRVFPCNRNEERKFKIGITSPLLEEDGKLKLKTISFAGPDFHGARETVRVRFPGYAKPVSLPGNFKPGPQGDYISEDQYDEAFEIAIDAVPLKNNQFTFDKSIYSIKPISQSNEPFAVNALYLDINHTWTDDELETLKPLISKMEVFVAPGNDSVRLSGDNFQSLTDQLQNLNFSLFPFYQVRDASHVIVVTKGTTNTPYLSDLKGSLYADHVQKYFATEKKVKVFNLEGGIAAYIRSIREMRGFEYTEGSAADLVTLISAKQFPSVEESSESVVLHDARLQITKTDAEASTIKDNAPDHLARLFAYNDIMRKVGGSFYSDDFVNAHLVEEARKAYVVSPVSSLVVLESEKDYKRFDIEDSGNSLLNASKQSSGAVPEPHEWALIILFALVAVYLKVRR